MNILVVSEKFCKGGLETHINFYYEKLKEKHNFYFAFGKYEKSDYLKDAIIYPNFNFSRNSSISDFILDVNQLVDIIKKYKIDVIHVHPFYSLFPAAIAANICKIKLIYSYHGYASINFVENAIDTSLFMFLVNHRIDNIISVSKGVTDYFNDLHAKKITYIPNLIDESTYNKHRVTLNKKWAFVSRIDADKFNSITKLLSIINELDISELDIFGSGDMESELQKYIDNNKLSNKVFIKGYTYNINESINSYTGVIGVGRVVIESLCMNYPTMFVGYNKIIGVIDKKIYNEGKELNFVPQLFDEISVSNLKEQINEINNGCYAKYQFRRNVINDLGTGNIKKYLDVLKNTDKCSLEPINEFYNSLNELKDKKQIFYESFDVLNLIDQKFSPIVSNIFFKALVKNALINLKNKNDIKELKKIINKSNKEKIKK